uniref:hypothetical protein n=1 Tax=Brasilonema sp. UFV-L1 TaxID=2234130 RepID=UPI001B7CF655
WGDFSGGTAVFRALLAQPPTPLTPNFHVFWYTQFRMSTYDHTTFKTSSKAMLKYLKTVNPLQQWAEVNIISNKLTITRKI